MLVVVAPDSFAGTLSASEAAAAIADGWRRQRPDDDVRCVPMADGGEGTLDVVEAAVTGARRHTAEVADARAYATAAAWLELPDGTALIESARACGLSRLDPELRSPRLATTYGVGQLIAAAIAAGAREIIVGLGGSATVDGGAGMATALGHKLLRSDGNGVKVGGEYLALLDRIVPRDLSSRDHAGQDAPPVTITAAADVTATLLGASGAVAGFAAQKGARPEDLDVLEAALRTLADVAERDLSGGPWRDLPGAGAAGGLGFGLAAFLGARLAPGAQLIADLVGLPAAVHNADIVLTGEGRLDAWSHQGKAPGTVVYLARASSQARVVAIAGSATAEGIEPFDSVHELGVQGLDNPAEALATAAAEAAAKVS